MLPKCLKCSRKIPLSWINFSSYRTKYRCIKCGTHHNWNSRRQVTSIVVALSVAVNINLLNYYFQFYWINLSLSLIVAMFISDAIIGFHPYQFVIYSTILTIALVSPMHKNYVRLGVMAVGGSVWFFITTNFAEWMIWDYYPKTIEGLITCYTLAIPFFKNTLISTCLFTGLLTFSIKYLEVVNKKTNHLISNLLARI